MTNSSLLDELESIDAALLSGDSTEEQDARGQELVQLANAAPQLLEALEHFFNIMHDHESSVRKGYIQVALSMAKRAIAQAKGEAE